METMETMETMVEDSQVLAIAALSLGHRGRPLRAQVAGTGDLFKGFSMDFQ